MKKQPTNAGAGLVIAGNNCYTGSDGAESGYFSTLDLGMLTPFVVSWEGDVRVLSLVTESDRPRIGGLPNNAEALIVANRVFSRGIGRVVATPVLAARIWRQLRGNTVAYGRLPSPMGTMILFVAMIMRVPTFCSIHGIPQWHDRPTPIQKILGLKRIYGLLMGHQVRRCKVRFATSGEALIAFGGDGVGYCPLRSTLLDRLPDPSPVPGEFGRKLSLAYVGRFSHEKNPLQVFDVCDTLEKRGFKVVLDMVGSGPMDDLVRERASRSGYRTESHGWVDDRAAVLDVLRRADFVLIPSLTEGSPKTLVEAMALGKPALILPHSDTVRELGKTGGALLMTSLSPDEWADRIVREWEPRRYASIACYARESVRDMTVPNLIRQIRDVLEREL